MALLKLPTKAWARKQADGTIHCSLHFTRADAIRWSNTKERTVRVTIIEGDTMKTIKSLRDAVDQALRDTHLNNNTLRWETIQMLRKALGEETP